MKGILNSLWFKSILALCFGIIGVLISAYIPHAEQGFPLKDIIRDIGIAFLVAGIISILYEWNTRNTEKILTMKSVLDKSLSTLIPEALWEEVKADVLARRVFRSDMILEVTYFENEVDFGAAGGKIEIPKGQVVLKTVMKYNLQSVFAGNNPVGITHHLDQHMRNETIDLPRFTFISITEEGKSEKTYSGVELSKHIVDGRLTLLNTEAINVSNKGESAVLNIERYELVSMPGLYTMVMPEMVIPSKKAAPTITVHLKTAIPENVNFRVETWFNSKGHNFVETEPKTKWQFQSVMLPGQGFSLIFSKK
jgi:hypothetical protein